MKILRRYLFFFLIIILPVNLGKHFDLNASYISGIIVDYLVPVIYLQDIVAFVLVFIWLIGLKVNLRKIVTIPLFTLYIFFIVGLFLSVLVSEFPFTSFTYFFRIVLYSCVALYIVDKSGTDFTLAELPKLLTIPLFYSSLLGIAQFINQGSIFNNYLVLGEQPYNSGIKAILKERVFDYSVIPPYSTFRHPNTFAGFLSLLTAYLYFHKSKKTLIYRIILTTALCSMLLTFSVVAISAFIAAIMLYLLLQRKFLSAKHILFISVFVFIFGLSLPLFEGFSLIKTEPSLYRRIELLNKSYSRVVEYTPFGIGIGTSTYLFKSSIFLSRDYSFFQPVHNIFVLVLIEGGVVSFTALVLSLIYLLKSNNSKKVYLSVLLFQIVLIGSFDHYLMTMHQTNLLLFLLLGLSVANKDLLAKK